MSARHADRGGAVEHRTGRHRAALIASAVAVAVLATGGVAAALAGRDDTAPTGSSPIAAPAATPDATTGFQDPAAPLVSAPPAGAVPTRVQIPSLGVDSGLESLGIGPQGELDAPIDWDSAGWFTDGPVPGGVGPAIIAGHVDSTTGPAVFARLDELAVGDEVLVTLSTGDVSTFRVSGEQRSAKAAFPTSDVYGPSPTPSLRLITCDGTFDRSTGHYEDNLIVYADLVAP